MAHAAGLVRLAKTLEKSTDWSLQNSVRQTMFLSGDQARDRFLASGLRIRMAECGADGGWLPQL